MSLYFYLIWQTILISNQIIETFGIITRVIYDVLNNARWLLKIFFNMIMINHRVTYPSEAIPDVKHALS